MHQILRRMGKIYERKKMKLILCMLYNEPKMYKDIKKEVVFSLTRKKNITFFVAFLEQLKFLLYFYQ